MPDRDFPTLFSSEFQRHPFLKSLHKELDRAFDRFRDGNQSQLGDLMSMTSRQVLPALDIAESDASMKITAELPGVSGDDVDISITDGVLTLKGEKTDKREESEKDYHLVERRYGSFRRSVPLGFMPEDGKVHAEYSDGVLKLRIEKPAAAVSKTQTIKIDKN